MIQDVSYHYQQADFWDIRDCFFTFVGRTLRDHWSRQYVDAPNPFDVFSHRQSENARGRRNRVSATGLLGVVCMLTNR